MMSIKLVSPKKSQFVVKFVNYEHLSYLDSSVEIKSVDIFSNLLKSEKELLNGQTCNRIWH